MLQNILLKADEWNSVTKQGKHLRVVLASGDIDVRITLVGGRSFQTLMVAGMAFPVLEVFESVAFRSAISQQTKIWLGERELDYTPNEIKQVGSSGLISESPRVFYGAPQQLIPAKMGRSTVRINPKEDIYIGGVDFDLNSEIKIAANEVFAIETQAPIYAYSKDTKNAVTVATVVDSESTLTVDVAVTGAKGSDWYMADTVLNDAVNSIYTMGNGVVYAMTDSEPLTSVQVDTFVGTPCGAGGFGDVYRVLSRNGQDLILTEFEMITGGSTSTVIHTFTEAIISPSMVRFNGDYLSFMLTLDGVQHVAQIKLKVSASFLPVLPELGGLYQLNVFSDGTVVANSNLYVQTWDFGAGAFGGVKPIGITPAAHNDISVDQKTNFLYLTTNFVIYESKDAGYSWQSIFTQTGSVLGSTVHSVDGRMIVATQKEFLVMDKDKVFQPINDDADGYNGSNVKLFLYGKSGAIYTSYAGKINVISGSVVYGGGLPVAVMSEVN